MRGKKELAAKMSTMTMSTEFLRRPDSGDAVGFGRSKSNSFSSFFSDRKQGSLASWRPSVASSSPPVSSRFSRNNLFLLPLRALRPVLKTSCSTAVYYTDKQHGSGIDRREFQLDLLLRRKNFAFEIMYAAD